MKIHNLRTSYEIHTIFNKIMNYINKQFAHNSYDLAKLISMIIHNQQFSRITWTHINLKLLLQHWNWFNIIITTFKTSFISPKQSKVMILDQFQHQNSKICCLGVQLGELDAFCLGLVESLHGLGESATQTAPKVDF